MNGRLYDPTIARMLQPDPLVQAPDNLQSYNRYTYCFNNPSTCTDPTGFSSDSVLAEIGEQLTENDRRSQIRRCSSSGAGAGAGCQGQAERNSAENSSGTNLPGGESKRSGVGSVAAKGETQTQSAMDRLVPKGDFFRTAGEAWGAVGAWVVGVATRDQALQDVAIDGMRENVSSADGVNAAIMLAGSTRGGATPKVASKPTFPKTAKEMDQFLGMEGKRVPDTAATPGRNKVVWQPNSNTKITLEQHPYHPNAPDWHRDPHYHVDTPGNSHERFLPGDQIPGF